jgi:hypothetical protein
MVCCTGRQHRSDGCCMEPKRRQREYSEAAECEKRAAETLDPIAAHTDREAERRWRELADRTIGHVCFGEDGGGHLQSIHSKPFKPS